MSDPWRLSLSEGRRSLADGALSATEWVRSLFGRIDDCEERIRAWAHVDRKRALASAEEADRRRAGGGAPRPLEGVPVGFKDIIDVVGMPTEAGSPLLAGNMPGEDSAVAARFREAGAVLLGKAVTTQFATADPSETRNPWNLERSPGGSSSGSAAAVACGMVPAALGSQTGGSTLRPSAFCGVVGLKPTYGRIPRTGLVTVSWTLDHVGVITRTALDAACVLSALAGADGVDAAAPEVPVANYEAASEPRRPERVFFLKEETNARASAEVAARVSEGVARMREAGVDVSEGRLPVDFDEMHAGHRIIMRAEAAAYHEKRFAANPDAYAPEIRQNVSMGLMVPAVHYIQALRLRARFAREMERLFGKFDLMVLPASVTTAPVAEESTGSALFNEPMTQIGCPAITLPLGRGEMDLPIGIQLGGGRFEEAGLIASARWCEAELGWVVEIAEPPEAMAV